MALLYLRLLSGTYLPHHSSWGCALSRTWTFYREETCFCRGV